MTHGPRLLNTVHVVYSNKTEIGITFELILCCRCKNILKSKKMKIVPVTTNLKITLGLKDGNVRSKIRFLSFLRYSIQFNGEGGGELKLQKHLKRKIQQQHTKTV